MRDPKVRLRGLSEIVTNSSRLILAEQLSCGSPPRFILEIDIGELLATGVLHDEGLALNFRAKIFD